MSKSILSDINFYTGLKAIFGSGLMWAWFDAIFMSCLFTNTADSPMMPEAAAILIFAFSTVPVCLAFARCTLYQSLQKSNKTAVASGVCGFAGSALLLVSSITANWILLTAGSLLCGFYMGDMCLRWGAVYSQQGAKTALVEVSGAFAFAIAVDTIPLFMVPAARALCFAVFALASAVIWLCIDPQDRSYSAQRVSRLTSAKNPRSWLNTHLGLRMPVLFGLMLIMIGFGFLQHLVSFSSVASGGESYGILIQVVRGITAILLFLVVVFWRPGAGIVCPAGLVIMVGGFMAMPFVFGDANFWIPGAIVIGGYTAFDLLMWTVISEVSHGQSNNPVRTMVIYRLMVSVCYCIGAVLGIMLIGYGNNSNPFISQETTVVGYLVVIAIVLLIGSEDVRVLFKGDALDFSDTVPAGPADEAQVGSSAQTPADDTLPSSALQEDASPGAFFEHINLTAREQEIALLLLQGRTQPWIASALNISENTVGSHMRHIYQKADVHDRQQFIDLAHRTLQ